MAYELRDYAGGAVATTLSAGINATDLSISIASATGWPSGGANGPFFVVVDHGLAGEEKVEVQSRTGTTLTVASTGKRGVDGTSAASHSSGATIIHCFTAQDADEANAHIANTALDHHTQYLNTTRHDVTARHTIGSVVPAAGTPSTITPDAAASNGSSGNVARVDHTHAIAAAAASTITGTNAEGSSSSFARADHNHAVDNAAITSAAASALTLTSSNSEGSGALARANHGHSTAALPWGKVADQVVTSNGTAFSTNATTDFTLTPTVDATRSYRVMLKSQAVLSAAGTWNIDFYVDGVLTGRMHAIDFDSGGRDYINASHMWEPSSGSPTIDIRVAESSGSSTIQFEAAADNPRQFWLEDIGPR